MSHISVEYLFPPGADPHKNAQMLAIGQTAGTWRSDTAGLNERIKKHLGEVGAITPQEDGSHCARIYFPSANVEGDIASLLTMIFGKYSMGAQARVVDVRLPEGYGVKPKYGLRGVRLLTKVQNRPLFMAIGKPSLGLSPEEHADIHREVASAGLDIIKDEELHGDLTLAPTIERLRRIRPVIDDAKQSTGREMLYAINVTGRADKLLEKARALVSEGANALLINVLAYGFSVLEALAEDSAVSVPLFAHPALAGALCFAPGHGFDYSVLLGTLMAHAGADAVLYPSALGNLPFDPVEEKRLAEALRKQGAAPVPSAGVLPGKVPAFLAAYGEDVILNAGTSIMDHPGGRGEGVGAFHEALKRSKKGESFALADLPEGPLRVAIEKWGEQ